LIAAAAIAAEIVVVVCMSASFIASNSRGLKLGAFINQVNANDRRGDTLTADELRTQGEGTRNEFLAANEIIGERIKQELLTVSSPLFLVCSCTSKGSETEEKTLQTHPKASYRN
jgi:hypothetical protein